MFRSLRAGAHTRTSMYTHVMPTVLGAGTHLLIPLPEGRLSLPGDDQRCLYL